MPDPIKDLASKVRAKYGDAYSDMDDATLARKVLRRYPQYEDVASAKDVFDANDTDSLVDFYSRKNGIDPDLTRAVIGKESSGKPNAVSQKGAKGLMQLMPGTAQRFNVKNIFDPHENINGGTQYLKFLLDNFQGDVSLALAGYNAGEGAVKKFGNKIPPFRETQDYVKTITGRYQGKGYASDDTPTRASNVDPQTIGRVDPANDPERAALRAANGLRQPSYQGSRTAQPVSSVTPAVAPTDVNVSPLADEIRANQEPSDLPAEMLADPNAVRSRTVTRPAPEVVQRERGLRGTLQRAEAKRNALRQAYQAATLQAIENQGTSPGKITSIGELKASEDQPVTSIGELQRREGRFGASRRVSLAEMKRADNEVIQAQTALEQFQGLQKSARVVPDELSASEELNRQGQLQELRSSNRFLRPVLEGLQGSVGGTLTQLGNLVDLMGKNPQYRVIPGIGAKLDQARDYLRRQGKIQQETAGTSQAEYDTPDRGASRHIDTLLRIVGATPLEITKIMSLPGGAVSKFAALGALENEDKGIAETAKGAAKGAAIGAVFGKVAPFSRPVRAGVVGAATYGIEKAAGADNEQAATSALTNAAFAAMGGKGRYGARDVANYARGKVPVQDVNPNLPGEGTVFRGKATEGQGGEVRTGNIERFDAPIERPSTFKSGDTVQFRNQAGDIIYGRVADIAAPRGSRGVVMVEDAQGAIQPVRTATLSKAEIQPAERGLPRAVEGERQQAINEQRAGVEEQIIQARAAVREATKKGNGEEIVAAKDRLSDLQKQQKELSKQRSAPAVQPTQPPLAPQVSNAPQGIIERVSPNVRQPGTSRAMPAVDKQAALDALRQAPDEQSFNRAVAGAQKAGATQEETDGALRGQSTLEANVEAGRQSYLNDQSSVRVQPSNTVVRFEEGNKYSEGQRVQLSEEHTGVGERVGVVTRVDSNGEALDIAAANDSSRLYYKDGRPVPIGQPTELERPAQETTSRYVHTDFGEVTKSENQDGVPRGKVRVEDSQGVSHVIQQPKANGRGNERAVPVKPLEQSRNLIGEPEKQVSEKGERSYLSSRLYRGTEENPAFLAQPSVRAKLGLPRLSPEEARTSKAMNEVKTALAKAIGVERVSQSKEGSLRRFAQDLPVEAQSALEYARALDVEKQAQVKAEREEAEKRFQQELTPEEQKIQKALNRKPRKRTQADPTRHNLFENGRDIEDLMRSAIEDGYLAGQAEEYKTEKSYDPTAFSVDDFVEALAESARSKSASGNRQYYSSQSEITVDEVDGLSQEEKEQFDAEMRFLADPLVVKSLKEVENGNEDEGLREELYITAANYGLPDEAVDANLSYSREIWAERQRLSEEGAQPSSTSQPADTGEGRSLDSREGMVRHLIDLAKVGRDGKYIQKHSDLFSKAQIRSYRNNLYMNPEATELLRRFQELAYGMEPLSRGGFEGTYLPRDLVDEILYYVKTDFLPKLSGAERTNVNRFYTALRDAAGVLHGDLTVTTYTPGLGYSVRPVVEEEVSHRTSARESRGKRLERRHENLESNPLISKAIDYLKANEYPEATSGQLLDEVFAKARRRDRASALGVTQREADAILRLSTRQYFENNPNADRGKFLEGASPSAREIITDEIRRIDGRGVQEKGNQTQTLVTRRSTETGRGKPAASLQPVRRGKGGVGERVQRVKRGFLQKSGQKGFVEDPITRTENFKRWFEGSKVVDDNGNPLVVYSGHANVDLYGEAFDPRKGTSGGFYATESPDMASNYAEGKFGVKEYYENGEQYRFKLKNGRWGGKLWQQQLTPEQQAKARKFLDELGYDVEQYWRDYSRYEMDARRALARGGLRDLFSIWKFMDSMGETIAYTDEQTPDNPKSIAERQNKDRFQQLLDHLNIPWQSYDWAQPGVMPVYLSIKNPLDGDKPFPPDLLAALKQAAKGERTRPWEQVSDARWTAEYPLKEWIKEIESGEDGWSTQVPKKALPILKRFGYDGIKERGLKGSDLPREQRQINWIAFDPTQIKSASGNRGTFSAEDPNILRSAIGASKEAGFIRINPRKILSVANLSRAFTTAFDLSAGLRQGKMALPRHPLVFLKSFIKQFQALNTSEYERIIKEIEQHPYSELARESGLYLASRQSARKLLGKSDGPTLSDREEAFMTDLAEKIPGVKHSNQAYAVMLDTLRMGWFEAYVNKLKKLRLQKDADLLKALETGAELINNATGRGVIGKMGKYDPDKYLGDAAPVINPFFFSPRFWVSRLRIMSMPIDPRTYSQMRSKAGRAAMIEQFKTLFGFMGLVALQLFLAKLSGADVELDEESPDFLQGRWGKLRVDFSAGFRTHIRTGIRLLNGIYRSNLQGEKLRRNQEAGSILGTYARGKESPNTRLIHDVFFSKKDERTGRGTDLVGRPVFVFGDPQKSPFNRAFDSAIGRSVIPMVWQDAKEAYDQMGWGGVGVVAPLTMFGEGVQVYENNRAVNPNVQRTPAKKAEVKRSEVRSSPVRRVER